MSEYEQDREGGEHRPQDRHIILVEDSCFQRLALVDILHLCGYRVSAFSDGAAALKGLHDILLSSDPSSDGKDGGDSTALAHQDDTSSPSSSSPLRTSSDVVDLVLCDIVMPVMDGVELLRAMKAEERLKDIPVVMMSANENSQVISSCIDLGARDYLVKPVRLQTLQGVHKYFGKLRLEQERYELLQLIGRGASGSVHLVRRERDSAVLALKQICTDFMMDVERDLAQTEVVLLKLLKGPTVVQHYDSWKTVDSISIVMEYCEGGTLYDKISDARKSGLTTLPYDQVLRWTSQMILGVLTMHSKQILHRDLKPQNLFLTAEGNVKLGDFGIAKALATSSLLARTAVGTPYFMSPEVCRSRPYGNESDMWALGCILYELLSLRRPFENTSIQVLFNDICEKAPPPLTCDTSDELEELCLRLLVKNPQERLTAYEAANVPSVKAEICRFVEEQQCHDDVAGVIDLSHQS